MYPSLTLQNIGILYILLADFENIIIEIQMHVGVWEFSLRNKQKNKEEEET